MTLAQVVQALEATPLWQTLGIGGIVMGVVGMIGNRIVKAFDNLVSRVEGFQTIMASHEREDVTRFGNIELAASRRHDELKTMIQHHADEVTKVTTPLQSRVTDVELIVERRQWPKPPKVD